jgi:hypothetical protein
LLLTLEIVSFLPPPDLPIASLSAGHPPPRGEG